MLVDQYVQSVASKNVRLPRSGVIAEMSPFGRLSVQLKKGRDTKTLHRATVDKQTGSIKFKPKGRKTWVDYDVQKHTIIRLNKEVSDEEDQDEMDPAESEDESEEEKYMEEEKPKQRARAKSNKNSTSSKKTTGTKRKASSTKRKSPVKSRSHPATYKDCSSTEDESGDDSDDEKSASESQEANNPKMVYASTSRVIDTFKDSDFGGGDWRTQGVIDY
eukprot:scaffold4035_cov52-Attheya_sp.AAC.3